MHVLCCLAVAPGRVVSRNALLDAVWSKAVVNEEALTHAVSLLRRVFGDEPKHARVIQTIHKTGYRLVQPVEWLEPTSRPPVGGLHRPAPIAPAATEVTGSSPGGATAPAAEAPAESPVEVAEAAAAVAGAAPGPRVSRTQGGPGVHRPCADNAGGLGGGHSPPFTALGSAQAGGAGRGPLHHATPAERPIRRSPRTAPGSPSPGGKTRAATTTSTSSSATPRRPCG